MQTAAHVGLNFCGIYCVQMIEHVFKYKYDVSINAGLDPSAWVHDQVVPCPSPYVLGECNRLHWPSNPQLLLLACDQALAHPWMHEMGESSRPIVNINSSYLIEMLRVPHSVLLHARYHVLPLEMDHCRNFRLRCEACCWLRMGRIVLNRNLEVWFKLWSSEVGETASFSWSYARLDVIRRVTHVLCIGSTSQYDTKKPEF